ncbi:hypothetical protein [Burkholderia sp. ABCPW 14]|uniref:hypothetical protein n=1 Tax=Burkholderia sp. ABCPW 14 TaxID=1637860 RepID=UPI0008330DF5|nr:hypothetical protein [Burkholderia sp. ABCPW 14]
MKTFFILIGLGVFVAFSLGWDRRLMEWRANRKDLKLFNCIVEQQARIDLCMTAIRLLLKTHPQQGDVAVLLRAATTHLSEASARETPNTHEVYERTIRNALKALVGGK